MSKRQYQLMLTEGKFWDNLVSPLNVTIEVISADPPFESSKGTLQELTHRRDLKSESYQVCTNLPAIRTYAECKDGYANYVVSEDTDVLRYEAAIIRDITSQQRPLIIIISGAELRSMLSLTHFSLDFTPMGIDFTQRIRNLRHSDALGFIRAHSKNSSRRRPSSNQSSLETLPLVPEDPTMWFRGDEE